MKKVVILGLFITMLGLSSVFAETWQEYINRAQTMEYNFNDGFKRGHSDTWSNDKWGALLATCYWLEHAYENIYRNAPNLTQNEKDIWRRLWQRKITMVDDLNRLYDLMILSNSDHRTIFNRYEYWTRHLENGGTIRIN